MSLKFNGVFSKTYHKSHFFKFITLQRPVYFGKAPDPDSICPKVIANAGVDLKSWLRTSLFSVCADSRFLRSGEERF